MSTKDCRTSIELFERLIHQYGFSAADQKLWLINPHYKQKFHLAPRFLRHVLQHFRQVSNLLFDRCKGAKIHLICKNTYRFKKKF